MATLVRVPLTADCPPNDAGVDRDLWFRVCNEYLEMPGLTLTIPQASRLWGTDAAASRQVLEGLVDAAFLRRRDGCYVRADADGLSA